MTQTGYILLLFNDCGFDTQSQRAAFMTRQFDRPIKYMDELYVSERGLLINTLKSIKEGKMDQARTAWKDGE